MGPGRFEKLKKVKRALWRNTGLNVNRRKARTRLCGLCIDQEVWTWGAGDNLCFRKMAKAAEVCWRGKKERKIGSWESIWNFPGLRGFILPLHREVVTEMKVNCHVWDMSRHESQQCLEVGHTWREVGGGWEKGPGWCPGDGLWLGIWERKARACAPRSSHATQKAMLAFLIQLIDTNSLITELVLFHSGFTFYLARFHFFNAFFPDCGPPMHCFILCRKKMLLKFQTQSLMWDEPSKILSSVQTLTGLGWISFSSVLRRMTHLYSATDSLGVQPLYGL